jgi:hypothetical protein
MLKWVWKKAQGEKKRVVALFGKVEQLSLELLLRDINGCN